MPRVLGPLRLARERTVIVGTLKENGAPACVRCPVDRIPQKPDVNPEPENLQVGLRSTIKPSSYGKAPLSNGFSGLGLSEVEPTYPGVMLEDGDFGWASVLDLRQDFVGPILAELRAVSLHLFLVMGELDGGHILPLQVSSAGSARPQGAERILRQRRQGHSTSPSELRVMSSMQHS